MLRNITKNYFSTLIQILYHQNEWFQSAGSISQGSMILIYYLQVLSYIFATLIENKEEKLRFLSKMIYYTNFSNLFLSLESKVLSFFIYFICFCVIIFLCLYVYLAMRTKKRVLKFNNFYDRFFQTMFWILLIPMIETLNIPLQCEEKTDYKCFSNFNVVFQILSIFGFLCIFAAGLTFIMFFQNIIFLNVNQLNFKEGFCPLICFLIRFFLPIIFPYLQKDYLILVLILQFLFLIISIFDYFRNLNPRYPKSQIHSNLQILLLFTTTSFVLHYYEIIIYDDDLFVFVLCLGVLASKIGKTLFERLDSKILLNNLSYGKFFICNLEELMRLFREKKDKNYSRLILSGVLKSHQKHCTLEKCKFSSNELIDFWNSSPFDQNNKIVSFINFQFLRKIEKEKKANNLSTELVFKYISFLVYFNSNYAFIYYQIQRLNLIFQNKGLLETILFQIFLQKIQYKIKGIQNQMTMKTENNHNMVIDTSKFMKLNKKKSNMEKHMISLLNSRILFWEKYRNGFPSYEEIMKEFIKENAQITNFHKKYIKKIHTESFEETLIIMKFSSIFYCVVLNYLSQGIKTEEHIEKMKQRIIVQDDGDAHLSLFENNLIICEASFLNKEGNILDNSKNDKMMSFFGYELQEGQAIKTIQEFMPDVIANSHNDFISYGFSKNRKNDIIGKLIKTYAKNKENFIFPINLNLGFSLHHLNDFIIHAAIRKEKNIFETVLFDKSGCVRGVTESFCKLFKTHYPNLRPKDFEHINIFILIPGLKQIIEKGESNNWKDSRNIRNYNAELIFPNNLQDILELTKFKEQQDKEEAKKKKLKHENNIINFENTMFSTISENKNKNELSPTSLLSMKSKKFLSSFQKLFGHSTMNNKKDALIRYLSPEKTSQMSLMENYQELIELKNSERLGIFYDLVCNIYRLGRKEDDYLTLFTLHLIETFHLKPGEIVEKETYNENIESSKISHLEKHLPEAYTSIFDKTLMKTQNLPQENEKEANLNEEDSKPNQIIEKKPLQEVQEFFKYDPKPKPQVTSNEDSDTKNNKMIDEQSKSSSLCNTKKNYETFEIMKKIESNFPLSLSLLIIFSVLDVIMVLVFGITIFSLSETYIKTVYEPIQVISINQCRTNIGIDISSLIVGEIEYHLHGITNLSDFQYNELNRILNLTYQIAIEKLYEDRNREYDFAFGEYLYNIYYPYIDYRNTSKINYILGTDLTDNLLIVLHNFIELQNYNKDTVKIILRNFPYYTRATRTLRERIQKTFVQTNLDATQGLMNVMICFILIMALVKIFELVAFNIFYGKLTNIIKIFLRVNDSDAYNEICFLKEAVNILKDSKHSYSDCNFADLRTNKKCYKVEENYVNIKKKTTSNTFKANKKKKNFQNFKSFSKLKVVLLLTAIFVVEFGYCFGTYYFWTIINENILKLIEINTMFNDLYIFTTTAFCNQAFVVRDKIFLDPEYVASGEKLQIPKDRQSYYDIRYRDRTNLLKTFISNLPTHALAAQNVIHNDIYDELMQGNLCKALKTINSIGDPQMEFCETMFDAALTKGIFTAMNQFTLYLSNRANISAIIDPKNTAAVEKQKADILEFLKEPLHTNVVIVDFYLSEAIYLFYLFLSEYYSGVLSKNIQNLATFMWIFCSGITVIMVIFVFNIIKLFSKLYKAVACSLGILPYEKITSDEQTVSLIKDYWKKRNKF